MLCLWFFTLTTPAHAAPPDVDEVFEQIEAKPAQRAALRRVAEATWNDLDSMAIPVAHQLAQDVIGVLSSDKIDKVALESARKGAVQLFDQTSSELLPRAIEAAEILTPEQRQRAASLLKDEVARWLGSPAS